MPRRSLSKPEWLSLPPLMVREHCCYHPPVALRCCLMTARRIRHMGKDKPVALYVRVSTDEQSMENQKRELGGGRDINRNAMLGLPESSLPPGGLGGVRFCPGDGGAEGSGPAERALELLMR